MKKTLVNLGRSLLAACSAALVLACSNPLANLSPAENQNNSKAISVNPAITSFITRQGDKLMENGQVFRFHSINVPNLHIVEDADWLGNPAWHRITEFEQRDAFQTLVQLGARATRTYTFTVRGGKNNGQGLAHYYGPNNYDEELFKDFDRTLALANEYGVRLIIPIIDEWDWVGGRNEFAKLNGGGDFYSNAQVKQAFKNWISYILNRTNTITGVKYKDDKAILAWETGNELQNTPWAWTDEMAKHMKSIDTNHLVVDGVSYPVTEAINSSSIDICSSHYYTNGGNNYLQRTKDDVAKTRGKKVFILGEYGLTDFNTIKSTMDYITSDSAIAGGMLWSLRYHAENGGFYWHDDQGQVSYHFPGFDSNSVSNEKQIFTAIRSASFAIRGLSEPAKEKPATAPILIKNGNTFAWKGSVGAEYYTIERAEAATGPWTVVAPKLSDADRPFKPWTDNNVQSGKTYFYRIKAVNAAGTNPDFSNENQAPVVSAGADIASTIATVSLAGSVSDDGKPLGGSLSVQWSVLSGPGLVSFANANNAATTATLSVKGDYVLKLSASDSLLSSSATVKVSYGSIPLVKKYEAESAVYTGFALKTDGSASNGAYLEIRDTGSVEWTVTAASAGVAELAFGYRAPFNAKQQALSVNGVNQAAVDFAQTNSFAEVKVSLALNAGINKVILSKSWGWMDIDYLKVSTKDNGPTPPSVNITKPLDSQIFYPEDIIAVEASATDSDGTIAKVEFYANGILVSTDTTAPYQASVSASIATVSAPQITLSAKATDNDGLSAQHEIKIMIGFMPPVPQVKITSPLNGSKIVADKDLVITADASVAVRFSIARVDFYIGDTLIASDTTAPYSAPWHSPSIPAIAVIKAVAFDTAGTNARDQVSVEVIPDTPVPPVSITYTKNDWGSGFSANIVIKNNGTSPINGWKLAFNFAGNQTLSNGWSASYTQTGSSVEAMNVDYNKMIAPGASVSIGFNANYSGTNLDPVNFVLTQN